MNKKRCFREPIPAIYEAASNLEAAVNAHLDGRNDIAEKLFVLANDPKVRKWTESIWGKDSQYAIVYKKIQSNTGTKVKARMPTAAQKNELHKRDGCHCRFCGIPVIRKEVRQYIHKLYPEAVPWDKTNLSQHAAFQCMWAQYDHVVPHSIGGTNDLENLVITCAACNYGKMEYTLDELNLSDPRDFPPIQSEWDGLERILGTTNGTRQD